MNGAVWNNGNVDMVVRRGVASRCSNARQWRHPGVAPTRCRSAVGQGKTDAGVGRFQRYVSVWSSISALGALRFTDSMP